MGSSASSDRSLVGESNSGDAIVDLYRRYCTRAVSGGEETPHSSVQMIGGLPDLENYSSTVMSAAKQQLIKDIADDLAEKIKIPKLSPRGKSLDEVISSCDKDGNGIIDYN